MKIKLLALSVLFAPGLALAGTPINETRNVDARAHIDVSNVKGAVNVSAWDKNEVGITGTLGEGAKRLAIEGDASSLTVRVEGPERIAPEWWREKGTARLRDYYRIEDSAGRRYWIYRAGLLGDGRGGLPDWFLQGLCG